LVSKLAHHAKEEAINKVHKQSAKRLKREEAENAAEASKQQQAQKQAAAKANATAAKFLASTQRAS
jgi:hypothetical protein